MATDLVTRTDRNGLATLLLNRPDKLNSLNTAMFETLAEHVDAIRAETAKIGCVIVRGAGRCFSAGHDLGAIEEGESSSHLHLQASVIEQLANLPQPVIKMEPSGACSISTGLKRALPARSNGSHLPPAGCISAPSQRGR